jgi:hypothetical protein
MNTLTALMESAAGKKIIKPEVGLGSRAVLSARRASLLKSRAT